MNCVIGLRKLGTVVFLKLQRGIGREAIKATTKGSNYNNDFYLEYLPGPHIWGFRIIMKKIKVTATWK